MPQLPTVQLGRRNLAELNQPTANPNMFGYQGFEALSEVAKGLKKEKDAQDLIDLQQAISDRDEIYKQQQDANKTDPGKIATGTSDVFTQQFKDQAAKDDQAILSKLSPRVADHARVEFLKVQRTNYHAQFNDYASIRKNYLQGASITQRDELINQISSENDPALKADLQDKLTRHFDATAAAGIYAPDEIANQKRYAGNQLMSLAAQKDPMGFIKKVDAGEFNNSDATGRQMALNIAGAKLDLMARRDAAEGKQLSDQYERKYELQAADRKLDVGELRKTADTFGWPQSKVDGLVRAQLGLKVANPNESLLIEDALLPVDRSANPSMADIQAAERSLKNGWKDGSISANSPESRAAIRRLQSMADRLNVRADVRESRTEFDARQSLFDLYHKYLPGKNNKSIIAERASRLREIDDLPANERRGYIKNLEQEFERKKVENAGPKVDLNTLRGIQQKR